MKLSKIFGIFMVLVWVAIMGVLLAWTVFAAEAPVVTVPPGGVVISPTLISMLMAVIVPMLLAFGKAKLGLEQMSRLLPVLAAVLAIVIDMLQSLLTNVSLGPQTAGMVGLAGVGLREVVDQIKKLGA